MTFNSKRKVILVEGTNYSGKSTLLRGIKDEFPGSTVIGFHDYYHNQLFKLREKGEQLTTEQINSGKIPPHVMEQITKYNFDRIERAVEQIESEYLDTFLFDRFHGTDFVYKDLLFGKNDFGIYLPIENRLNAEDAVLVFMTVEDDVMFERMQNTMKGERLNNDLSVPYHLTDMDVMRKKRDLYSRFYDISTIDCKIFVISTNQTDNSELIKKIKEL